MNRQAKYLFHDISSSAYTSPLSELLPKLLAFARRAEYQELETWVRLELDGYYSTNSAMTEDVVVPEYRTVPGIRTDEWHRRLLIQDPRLQFVSEDRLRQGIAELERFSSLDDHITVQDVSKADIIKETLGAEVTRFSFHPTSVDGVLSSIRGRMIDWLVEAERRYPELELEYPSPVDLKNGNRRFRKVRVLGISLLAVSLIALLLMGIDLYLAPILPAGIEDPVLLALAALGLAVGGLLQFKKVYDFFDNIVS